MKKTLSTRLNILIVVICLVFVAFVYRLVQFQIIDGEKYFEQSNTTTRINQSVTASRGDITDINGVPLASSQTVFDVTINKAYMPSDMLNNRILETIKLLQQQGEKLNDILPMDKEYPYTLQESRENEIERLRNLIKVAVYATEDDILNKLADRYSLKDLPHEYWRAIAGIRYTMEREGYSNSHPFNMAEDVSIQTATIIKELSRELSGIEITTNSKRFYENGTLLPHILGTVGPIYAEEYAQLKEQGYGLNDILGKSGLEKSYENYLKGVDGTVQIEKNIYGGITDIDVIEEPTPGNTVKLTIDADLQQQLNIVLKSQVEFLQSRTAGWGKECSGASMVVIDTRTGGILAMGNYPSYDLNLYSSNYSEYARDVNTPLFNRAFQGLYRPGSVFKLNVALAGLASGLIDENYTFECTGRYHYYTEAEWGGALPGCANFTAHGRINVKQAIQVSCNCFFYDLGRRLGIDVINNNAQDMGLGVYTGIEVAEQLGRLSSPDLADALGTEWYAGNVIQASIGQLDTAVTTVQLATYANTIANRGTRYATHLVDSIVKYDNSEIVYETPATVLSQTDNINNAYEVVEKGMVMASTEGNAKIYLSSLPYIVASKSGTPQVAGDLYNATILAYGPVEDPHIAVAMIAEKGGNGYNLAFGVREIFKAYYAIQDARAQGIAPGGYAEYKAEMQRQAEAELRRQMAVQITAPNIRE